MTNLLIALIAAIAAPLIWGLMNVIDKYIVSRKVKHILGFTGVVACFHILSGLIFALFLDWSNFNIFSSIPSIIAGVLYGCQFFSYYYLLSKKDASHTIGLLYIYPIIIAILSFVFLNELISLQGYIGMFLIILGALTLSLHIKKLNLLSGFGLIVPFILCVAISEFLMKVSTNNIPALNGFVLNLFIMGLTILSVLIFKDNRKGFLSEIKNFRWAVLSESFTFTGLLLIYLAMEGLPATIVTALAAIQPMFVVLFESIAIRMIGNMAQDKNFIKKLISIGLIVLGAILIYSKDILNLII
jgi:drug/metabolite transporter (DMT)-like permease